MSKTDIFICFLVVISIASIFLTFVDAQEDRRKLVNAVNGRASLKGTVVRKNSKILQPSNGNGITTSTLSQNCSATKGNSLFCEPSCTAHANCGYYCKKNNNYCTCTLVDCSQIYSAASQVSLNNFTCSVANGDQCQVNENGYILMIGVLCVGSFAVFGCLLCFMAARQNRYLNDNRRFCRSGATYANATNYRQQGRSNVSRVNTRSHNDNISVIQEPALPKYEDIASFPTLRCPSSSASPLAESDIPPPAYEEIPLHDSSNTTATNSNSNSDLLQPRLLSEPNVATVLPSTSHGVSFVNDSFSV